MCGIAGYRLAGERARGDWIQGMMNQLVHRGPDGHGSLLREEFALGHRRLSIIDLAYSAQPMSSSNDRFHLTFNGEIFNYKELRKELEHQGVAFRTFGDTEVLLQALIHWGSEALAKLNGQFAFALFDAHARTLFLARDRVGILPLFYYYDGRRFAFASEAKALLALPWIPAELNEAAIETYLTTRSTAGPQTLFKNIRKLEPGSSLMLDAPGELRIERWWSLPEPAELMEDEGEAEAQILHCLSDSVRARLIADVPVGAYLSGGLDSSLVAALAATHTESALQCFVAGFGDERFDEVEYAREVADHCRVDLEVVPLRAGDFSEAYEKLTWHRDAPISEPGDVAVYTIAKLAAQRVKVLLSGEGADELFAGYPKHRFEQQFRWLTMIPPQVRGPIFRQIERNCPAHAVRARIAARALASRTREERWLAWFAPFTWYECAKLRVGYGGMPEPDGALRSDYVNAMLAWDCGQWLSDNLLERGDRMSMAASVENRPPFLDHRLIDLAFRIPGRMKIKQGGGKYILRNIARNLIPDRILTRRKVGFKVPIDEWFRSGMRDFVGDHLLSPESFVSTYFSRRHLEQLYQRHMAGDNEDIRLWTLLGLEVWSRRFIQSAREFEGSTSKPEADCVTHS